MDTVEFLSTLWRGGAWGNFFSIWPKRNGHGVNRRTRWVRTDQIAEAVAALTYPRGKQLFFGVHPQTQIPTTNRHGKPTAPQYVRSRREYTAAINCLISPEQLQLLITMDMMS